MCEVYNIDKFICTFPGILCFGPRMQAAKIESSKEFAKQFMSRFNFPTARWKSFTDADAACDFIRRLQCRHCWLAVCVSWRAHLRWMPPVLV